MDERLKKLNFKDLKDINGGQIFYARRGNQTEYFVPQAAEKDVNIYNRAWDAKRRAEDLGVYPEFVEFESVWTALSAAKTQASHLDVFNRVSSFVG